jgi:hypothetical protein
MLTLCRYDFTMTFDVIVGTAQGHQKRFPVYHDLLTTQSKFLLVARTSEPRHPVRLDGEGPEVFSLYLNCVYSALLQLPSTPSVNVLVQCRNLLLAVSVSPVQEALCSAGKIYLQANHTDA